MSGFERIDSEQVYEGAIFSVARERFRHADGEEVTRDVVHHQGAVAVVAHDDEHVWLVRQPREAVGEEGLLELPAGRRDVDGEPPEETARRELCEEVGKHAGRIEPVLTYLSSAGFTDERVHLFLATQLTDVEGWDGSSAREERIEIVPWPLERLDDALQATGDAKTLIGLSWLRLRRRS